MQRDVANIHTDMFYPAVKIGLCEIVQTTDRPTDRSTHVCGREEANASNRDRKWETRGRQVTMLHVVVGSCLLRCYFVASPIQIDLLQFDTWK